jgi:hypothetical protein
MTMSQETSMPAIVAPQVLLSNHLKALKLPTFAINRGGKVYH